MTRISGISNILAIRFARIGDVVLLLPALARLKGSFGGARLTLITGSRSAPIAKLCPYIDEVISVDRLRMRDGPPLEALRDIWELVGDLRSRRFDLVVDFHSFRETNLLARFSGARYRLGMKRADRAYLPFCFNLPPALEDKGLHVSEMFQRVVEHVPGLSNSQLLESPMIEVRPDIQVPIARPVNPGPLVVLYVGASVPERRWPASRFAALAVNVATRWGATVSVLSGVSEAELAIARQVKSEAAASAQLLIDLGIEEMASVIAGADLMVSNDSGPMHIGSALGVPTLGIFSSSLPEHYRPVGSQDRYIKKDSIMDVQLEEVLETIVRMQITGFPDRRL